MVRFDHTEVPVQMDYVNMTRASSQGGTAAVTGRNVYRLVAVIFGLLCVLQAALNISLRLTTLHSASKIKEIATEATCTNTSQELDKLKRKITTIDSHRRQGWVYFPSSLYYISSTTRSWSGSRADCLRRGADLVVIKSREEQAFIVKFNLRVWIGLTEKEGAWKWVDRSQLTESYWAADEPNNYEGTKEDCVEIRFSDINNSWNDVTCGEQHFWICEKIV
ncbi:CD209 antigen-like protein E [Phyllopteryx taeniolatus]|uniref:CD209 antigen-like protein E n=1 Tax=Phyllopteryx taeniolatus TaxID=161469 RepID=UPI002AD3330F|nr:CD209 antigen-like protein E [Phyllopteryx taeniolatus]